MESLQCVNAAKLQHLTENGLSGRNAARPPKYIVEYSIPFKKRALLNSYSTDHLGACLEFLTELLERGFHLVDVKREGLSVSRVEFDELVRNAASSLVSRLICASLQIRPDEEQFRFGFARPESGATMAPKAVNRRQVSTH